MWLEIFLATLGNIQVISVILAAVFLIGGLFLMFLSSIEVRDKWNDDAEKIKQLKLGIKFKRWILIGVCFLVPLLIPTLDDMWKVRISLIKLELAKPENVEAAVSRINEISKSLECKYLGENCKTEEAETK